MSLQINSRIKNSGYIIPVALIIGFFIISFIGLPALFSETYIKKDVVVVEPQVQIFSTASSTSISQVKIEEPEQPKRPPETHIAIPEAGKGIYMTSCVAGTPSIRKKIVQLVEDTELNAIIIDIKDYSGNISFEMDDPILQGAVGGGCYVRDMREFINELHKKGIYVIGRITVFQDPYYAKRHPDQAVQKESDKSTWSDYKGLNFIDVGSVEFWSYIVTLSKDSYHAGFDELNYDYIRYPSDGNMKDIYFPISEERVVSKPGKGKVEVLEGFFSYLRDELNDEGVYMSADIFGMTMTNYDDLFIGQILENIEPYFDFVAPMVYPSHYPKGFYGYQNVNSVPYEIVKISMDRGSERMIAASSSPLKLRPWLQDNDYPVHYTPEMVRAQIQATYDAGLTSWMLWDASNTYTREALLD